MACTPEPAPEPATANQTTASDRKNSADTPTPAVHSKPARSVRITRDQLHEAHSRDYVGVDTLHLDLLPQPATQTTTTTTTGVTDTTGEPEASVGPCDALDLATLAGRAREVRHLRVTGCGHTIGEGLAAWTQLEHLELTDIAIDGDVMRALAKLDNLPHLTLTRVQTGKAPVSLLHHKLEVEHLTLRELGPDSALASVLAKTPSLKRVDLIGPWAGHRAMLALAGASRLTHLQLIDTSVGNFSLNQIKGLDKLETVDLQGPTFNNNTPLYLRELPVASFTCSCPGLGDRGLVALSRVQSLQSIELHHADLHTKGLEAMKVLPNLHTLLLRNHHADPAGLEALAQHPALAVVEIACERGKPQPAPFAHLGTIAGLTTLALDCPGVNDRIAKELKTLTELVHLDLGNTAISDAGLAPVAAMKNLRTLKLHHTRVTHRGLAALTELGHLELLELDHTDVIDRGVAHLSGLKTLRELRLDHTLVTDKALASLTGLTQLIRLNLDGTVVTPEAAATLAKELPNLQTLHLGAPRHNPAH